MKHANGNKPRTMTCVSVVFLAHIIALFRAVRMIEDSERWWTQRRPMRTPAAKCSLHEPRPILASTWGLNRVCIHQHSSASFMRFHETNAKSIEFDFSGCFRLHFIQTALACICFLHHVLRNSQESHLQLSLSFVPRTESDGKLRPSKQVGQDGRNHPLCCGPKLHSTLVHS